VCNFITRCPIFDAAILFKSTGILKSVCSTQLTASAVASLAGPKGEIAVEGEALSASDNHVSNTEKSADDDGVDAVDAESGSSTRDFKKASDVFERTAAAVARDGHYSIRKKSEKEKKREREKKIEKRLVSENTYKVKEGVKEKEGGELTEDATRSVERTADGLLVGEKPPSSPSWPLIRSSNESISVDRSTARPEEWSLLKQRVSDDSSNTIKERLLKITPIVWI